MARHSQNLAPLLERLRCGDKCAGFRRRLHNHNRLAEAGNEVISFGKTSAGMKCKLMFGESSQILCAMRPKSPIRPRSIRR